MNGLVARRGGLAVAVAAVLVASGCGSEVAAATVVRQASDKTAAAGSARVALSVTFSTGGFEATLTGDGVLDLKNRRGAVAVDLGSAGGSLASGTVETVLAAEGLFVKLPGGILPAAKPWIRLDLDALASQPGVNPGSLGQLGSADPSQALLFLRGAVDGMKKVGTEKVRGADTTHYRGVLDLRKAAASTPPESQDALGRAIESLGTSSVPADVWVDHAGRMRKLRLSVDPDGAGGEPAGTAQFEMYDFGTAVDVQVPAADQVTDLSALFKGLPRK